MRERLSARVTKPLPSAQFPCPHTVVGNGSRAGPETEAPVVAREGGHAREWRRLRPWRRFARRFTRWSRFGEADAAYCVSPLSERLEAVRYLLEQLIPVRDLLQT
jgi:hypothetical protein